MTKTINTSSKTTLSGLIVAHNEEEMIEDALKSLKFCDEIVVVLDRCTDNTKKIAKKYTNNIIEGSWEIERVRRNIGIENCNSQYILELDADERVTAQLAEEIKSIIAKEEDAHYIVNFNNYVGNRHIRYSWAGSFSCTATCRLFKKGLKKWGEQRIHPSVELNGKKVLLNGSINHLLDKDLNDMIKRLNWYTDMRGQDMANYPLPHYANVWRRTVHRTFKSYISRKDYREGKMGIFIAIMTGLFQLVSYHKAVQIKKSQAKG